MQAKRKEGSKQMDNRKRVNPNTNRKPEGRKKRKNLELRKVKWAVILFLSAVAFYLGITVARSFQNTEAITLPEPIGIIYFIDNPNPGLIAHENYHLLHQIPEKGAIVFYLSYLLGQGCIYEAEAGAKASEHDVCDIPWMQDPGENQGNSIAEIEQWYDNYQRQAALVTAKQ